LHVARTREDIAQGFILLHLLCDKTRHLCQLVLDLRLNWRPQFEIRSYFEQTK